ncbi:LOW QUALITY PROTEIN: C3a anaphylatoxin chemotactic receptor-like [Colossoma macropomum]|uniref:LOW QUALITY PROTEIN: C3a anaphylatoxin chemotactic receptor-like n=1 Tax=Colossoma macropomum TaxID=42526 RepID=UPI001864591C|nr:LOW QUALITY PROTEIN: C3a anaphylatoxin chemotactic receptor-like [Colossoma macropomum]
MNSTPLTGTEYPNYKNHTTSQTTDLSSCDTACIFYAVANVIVIILGVAGNGLVIWIAGFKVKKSVVTTWYLSLALSDFIFCSFLPFSVVYMVKGEWIFGRFMCKFTSFIMWLNMFSSIFLLVIISVDRCVTVMFPVWAQNKRTIRKAFVIVMLAWITAAAFSTPSPVVRDIHLEQKTVCRYKYESMKTYTADVVCRFIFGFVIPFLVIIICYVVIIRKLKSNHMAKSKKPLKIMTVLIITFLICWLPYHIVALMFLFMPLNRSLPTAFVFCVFLSNVNSCLNPFLYAFLGRDFKKQCNALLSKIENAVKEDGLYTIQGTVTTTSGESRHSTSV